MLSELNTTVQDHRSLSQKKFKIIFEIKWLKRFNQMGLLSRLRNHRKLSVLFLLTFKPRSLKNHLIDKTYLCSVFGLSIKSNKSLRIVHSLSEFVLLDSPTISSCSNTASKSTIGKSSARLSASICFEMFGRYLTSSFIRFSLSIFNF
jgi:hypothetical protein